MTIAGEFNSYFAGVAEKLLSVIPPVGLSPCHYINVDLPYSVYLSPTSSLECMDIISKLTISSAKK